MITRRMDPTDLRAGLAERLAGREPIDAQTFNSACFMLSRALEELVLSVPEAAPLAKPCRLSEEDTDCGPVGDRFGIHILGGGRRCP